MSSLTVNRLETIRFLTRTWEALQVELNGTYSIRRLCLFSDYCDRNSSRTLRIVALLVATPLPCLGAIILADSIPLRPPGQGIAENRMFWVRAFVGAWLFTISFVVQFSQSLPTLPMTRTRVFLITWIVSIGGTAVLMVMSLFVGFPMPFMMVLGTPGWISFLVGSLMVQWGSTLRADPSIWPMVINCLKVFTIQMSLLVVYPVYNYFFQMLEGTQQALFSLALHVIKIGAKNAISRYFTHMEDMRPEVVIFNVEVFSALFTAFCMQSATSLLTTIMLMAADFLHACISLYDTNRLLQDLDAIEKEMQRDKSARRRTNPGSFKRPSVDRKETALWTEANVVTRVMELLVHSGTIINCHPEEHQPPLATLITGSSPNEKSSLSPHRSMLSHAKLTFQRSVSCINSKVAPTHDMSAMIMPNAQKSNGARKVTAASCASVADWTRSSTAIANMTPLSMAERKYIEKVLDLLHLTEFTILVEYTEVIIPAVYSVYLLIMSRLPNHVYYPQIAVMDNEKLHSNVRNVLLYSFLELVSFVVLKTVLKKRLKLSANLQLAFVLESQWKMVQSKLVLWVLYIVQGSLIHFGVDYSFQFKWLRETWQST